MRVTAPARRVAIAARQVSASWQPASTASPASANPAGTGLVISEVYGGGGNSGAVLNADFVELYNPTGAAVQLPACPCSTARGRTTTRRAR